MPTCIKLQVDFRKAESNITKKNQNLRVCYFFSREPKDSFLRALKEVAPEMELFLENNWQYIRNFVIELIYIQSCTFRHFTKKLYLEEYV